MIDKKTIEQVSSLAALAANKGYALIATKGSPLEHLDSALIGAVTSSELAVAPGDDSAEAKASAYFAALSPGECSQHTTMMDAFIKDIAKATQNHIAYARGVVSPAVVDMLERVKQLMGDDTDPASFYKVETVDLPLPMKVYSLRDSLKDYSGGIYAKPEKYIALEPLETAELKELALTGSKEIDDQIELWFASIGEPIIQSTWNAYFTNSTDAGLGFIEGMEDPKNGATVTVLVYLFARKLFDNVPENTGMSLEKWQTTCAQYRDCAARRMLDMYSLDDSRQQGNILLLQNNSYTNVVTVYGPVYKEYLAQGGSVEAILGAITNGTRIYTLEQALEAKEEALKAWDRYVNYTRIDTANRRFLQFKDVLRTAYNDAFMKASDEEKEVIASMPGYADTVKDLLNEQIGNIRSGDMNDLADTCTKIICRVRFYYNDAELILTGINKALQAKPDMDPREAALLSAVEYVANYVADQIQVVEIL